MAEIKIEKKKAVWPWILLSIIVIALLIYFLGFRNNDDNDNEVVQNITYTDTSATSEEAEGPVQHYVQFINEGRTMGLDHTYTNGALQRLTEAIRTKANEIGYDVTADLSKVEEHANNITKDPFETTHAKSIRGAAVILSNVMQNMQQSKFPGLQDQMENVNKAATSIDPNRLTLDQRDAVKRFFEQSSELLQNMN